MELNEEQTKLIEFLKKAEIHQLLPVLDVLEEISRNIKAVAEKEIPMQERPEVQKISIEGISVVTIKGKDGKDGADSTIPGPKGEIGLVGKDGKNGKDGRDGIDGMNGLDGKDGLNGEDGKDGSPDTGEQIIDKINEAEGLIKRERVEGLDELEKDLNIKISSIPRGGGGRPNNATKMYPLTANGVTKIFSVPKSVSSVVFCSDNLPSPLMENNGFTINATRTQITLTSENAPSYGAQLLYLYTSVFNT